MFSTKLKELRKEKGYTQSELSKLINSSISKIAMWETGKRDPVKEDLLVLSELFDVSIDYLLGKSNIKSHVSVKEYDNKQSDLPDKFTTAQDAIKYILKQPTLMAYGNCDIESLDEEDLIDFANDLLEQFKLLSYKYKK